MLALGILALGLESHALALESPRGKETFGGARMATAPAIPPKTIRLVWNYPAGLETPDLIFKVYHSTNLALPLVRWALLTNIPGYLRSVRLTVDKPQDYFVLTASNRLGESGYATR